MKTTLWLCAFALLSASVQAAGNPLQQAMAQLDAMGNEFVQAANHSQINTDNLTDSRYYTAITFPNATSAHTSIGLPDAGLDALTRAVLLVHTYEAPLPHTRYRVEYSMNVSPDVPEARQDYVEVRRYNLGPARRADLQASTPANHLADPQEFGVGPHVSWRFVMAPVMGFQAALIHAGRVEIPAAQAQADDCLGVSCLALANPTGPERSWQPVPSPQLEPALYASRSNWGVATPARVMQELWSSIAGQGMDPLPYQPGKAAFQFVISSNIDGQEAAVVGLARQSIVLDSTVSEIWTQRFEAEQTPPDFSTLLVPRR